MTTLYPMSKISSHKLKCPYTTKNDQICFPNTYTDSLNDYHCTINNFKSLKCEPDHVNKPDILFTIPINITNVEFINGYNTSIILSPNITHITLGSYYSRSIELTKNIIYADFGMSFDFTDNPVLPKRLEHLITRCQWNNMREVNLNKNLTKLQMILYESRIFDERYNIVDNVVRTIGSYVPTLILNKKLREYQDPIQSEQHTILSKNLIYLYINCKALNQLNTSNKNIQLPKSIRKIKILGKIKCHIILPPHLTCLMIGKISQLKPIIIDNLTEIIITTHENYHSITDNLPSCTKHIGIYNLNKEYPMNNIPHGVQSIWVPKCIYKIARDANKHITVKKKDFYDIIR